MVDVTQAAQPFNDNSADSTAAAPAHLISTAAKGGNAPKGPGLTIDDLNPSHRSQFHDGGACDAWADWRRILIISSHRTRG